MPSWYYHIALVRVSYCELFFFTKKIEVILWPVRTALLGLFEESKSTWNCSNSVSLKKKSSNSLSLFMYVQMFILWATWNLIPMPSEKEKNLLGIMGFYSYPMHKKWWLDVCSTPLHFLFKKKKKSSGNSFFHIHVNISLCLYLQQGRTCANLHVC